jgi:hypothetical protein
MLIPADIHAGGGHAQIPRDFSRYPFQNVLYGV